MPGFENSHSVPWRGSCDTRCTFLGNLAMPNYTLRTIASYTNTDRLDLNSSTSTPHATIDGWQVLLLCGNLVHHGGTWVEITSPGDLKSSSTATWTPKSHFSPLHTLLLCMLSFSLYGTLNAPCEVISRPYLTLLLNPPVSECSSCSHLLR